MKPVEALNRLNEIAFSFMITQTFSTACNLGVFEELSKEPTTIEGLAGKTNIHSDGCGRLLVALKQLGLVDRTGELFYNSELGNFLTSKSPVPLGPLSLWGSPWPHMWEFLPDALRELSPRWQQALDTTAEETFAALYEDPIRLREFCKFMDAFSIPIGQEIAEHFDFTPYRCLMDIAGGPGGLSIQIGLKYPHLLGIVMDLPPVCKVAEEQIEANGLSDRFTTETADLLTGPYPLGADAIVLSWILHDWSDENCRQILQNCFEALPSKGVLLISEKVLNKDLSGEPFGVFLSLHMLVVCEPGAKERSEAEYQLLLEKAGFQDIEIVRLNAPRDLIIARKP